MGTDDGAQPLSSPQARNNIVSDPITDKSDFVIPSAPGTSNPPPMAPPSLRGSETATKGIGKNDDEDKSDDNSFQPPSSSGKDSSSYNDLAARFENLKNL